MSKIGEFELLVVLAILRQEETPFANQVRRDLIQNAKRSVTRGALYRTLDRLKEKGLVDWSVEQPNRPSDDPSARPTGDRGGLPMRRLEVTDKGIAAVRQSKAVLLHYFEGLDTVLDRR